MGRLYANGYVDCLQIGPTSSQIGATRAQIFRGLGRHVRRVTGSHNFPDRRDMFADRSGTLTDLALLGATCVQMLTTCSRLG